MKRLFFSLLFVGAIGCTSYERIHVVSRNMASVAYITTIGTVEFFGVELGTATISGTGVAISKAGHILTCAHLIDQGQTTVDVEMYGSDQVVKGTVLSVDPERDLALVKISTPTPTFVRVADNGATVVGQDVVVIGNPLGLKWTVTAGIVSGFRVNGLLMQVDADLNPGNSGGPVFNLAGELIGIANSMRSPIPASVGLNFAVSVEAIHEFLNQFDGL